MKLVPLTRDRAAEFVKLHHRHAFPRQGDQFRVGLEVDGQLVGVASAGRPCARALDDGATIEVTRLVTDGTPNACSKLYAAIVRAARSLGYERAVTYTLESEPGSSLRAVGFRPDGSPRRRKTWSTPARERTDSRAHHDVRRQRWVIEL